MFCFYFIYHWRVMEKKISTYLIWILFLSSAESWKLDYSDFDEAVEIPEEQKVIPLRLNSNPREIRKDQTKDFFDKDDLLEQFLSSVNNINNKIPVNNGYEIISHKFPVNSDTYPNAKQLNTDLMNDISLNTFKHNGHKSNRNPITKNKDSKNVAENYMDQNLEQQHDKIISLLENFSSNVPNTDSYIAIPFKLERNPKSIHIPNIYFDDPEDFNESPCPKCPHLDLDEDGIELSELGSKKDRLVKNNKEINCSPGSNWISLCHECVCDSEGTAKCKKMSGCRARPYGEPMLCKPYSIYKLDACNNCECNGDGVPVCTFIDCEEPPIHRDAAVIRSSFSMTATNRELLKKPTEHLDYNSENDDSLYEEECESIKDLKRCAPGTRWRSSCYDCSCNGRGSRNCLRVPNCHLKKPGRQPRCKANLNFGTSCRPCICTDEGEPDCFDTCHNDLSK